MTEFTPYASLVGGAMIGFSAVLLMLWEDRIRRYIWLRRTAPAALPVRRVPVATWFYPRHHCRASPNLPRPRGSDRADDILEHPAAGCRWLWLRLGQWPHIEHGVCGLSRLSNRSLMATGVVMDGLRHRLPHTPLDRRLPRCLTLLILRPDLCSSSAAWRTLQKF